MVFGEATNKRKNKLVTFFLIWNKGFIEFLLKEVKSLQSYIEMESIILLHAFFCL